MNRLTQIKQMLENDRTDSFLMFALAKEHEKLEDFEESIKIYEQLKLSDPNYVGLYYHLASIYSDLGKRDLALATCKEGIEICKSLNDKHSLSELHNLGMNIEID